MNDYDKYMNQLIDVPPFSEQTQRARAAQLAWAHRPVGERLRPVAALRRQLVEHSERLCQAVTAEIGRPSGQVVPSEVLPLADAAAFLLSEAPRILRPRQVRAGQRPWWLWGQQDTVYRRPHGLVAVIGTWNYPIFLNGVQILQALTAGNAVLWKPSEVAPQTAEELHGLFLEAGFPADLFVRLDATRENGAQLLEADIDHLVFTGSAEVGRRIARRLGERLISSTLELSGCDAMFVLADADLPLAARAAWFATTLNRGQTCLAVRRVFVHHSRYKAFVEQLTPLVAATHAQELTLVSQVDFTGRLISEALKQGARQLVDRPFVPPGEASPRRCQPNAIIDATPEMALCHEAFFSPVLTVLAFNNLEQAIQMDGQCAYALGASIFTNQLPRALALAARLQTGTVAINDVVAPTAHPATPFGGRRASGWGVTQGPEGLLELTVPQVISVRVPRDQFRPHYDMVNKSNTGTDTLMQGMLRFAHGGGWRARWRGLLELLRGGRDLQRSGTGRASASEGP